MLAHPKPLPPGAAEQLFRLFDQNAENFPLCRTNVAAIAEFDLLEEKLPTLEALKTLIKEKLSLLPCLTHFLETRDDKLAWVPFTPDLDTAVTEKTIPPGNLHEEFVNILKSKIPYNAPWKIIFLSGYDPHKFTLLWCVRHEVIDGGSRAHIFETLFGNETQKPFHLPSREKITAVPPELLQSVESPEEAALFWKNIAFTTERKIAALQMPSSLLSTIGKSFGVSGNDIYLAAAGHSLWKWRKQLSLPIPKGTKLPLLVPINLRPQGDYHAGNRFYTARLNLPEVFSPKIIAEQIDVFRKKEVREGLAALYQENPSIAAAKCPSPEYFSAGVSSFRITKALKWGKYPLSRTAQIFNTPAKTMPFFSAFSAYEPKEKQQRNNISTLFFSLDIGIEALQNLPNLWKEAVQEIAQQAKVDLRSFGEDPIQVFC